MPLVEQLYCSQQLNVPPKLPTILKQFCKAAIRTQPYDLLKWSSAYFRALADGEELPSKIRLEYPPPCTPSGLTPGFLKVLLRQFGDYNKKLSVDVVLRRWDCLCLDRKDLNLIMMIGKFRHECQVKKFLAIAAGLLNSSLFETMVMICELFSHEPDGGSAMIPVTLFMEIYGYLAGLRCDGSERESFDEDLSSFVASDKSDRRISSTFSRATQESNGNVSAERAFSVNSQDTEIDVNIIELESTSKEDDESAKKVDEDTATRDSNADERIDHDSQVSKEEIKSDEEGGEISSRVDDSEHSKNNQKSVGNLIECEKENMSIEEVHLNGAKKNAEWNGDNSNKAKDPQKIDLAIEKEKTKKIDPTLLKRYPDVPGIGPRLSAEQVANVAIWLSECARQQEGMVGPRNLRHLQCPPLSQP